MDVHLDWQVGDESGRWEAVVAAPMHHRRRIPHWAWSVLAASLVTLALVGYVVMRLRYSQTLRQAAFQIQSVIDLETRALEERDRELYMAQQDQASQEWYALQAARFSSSASALRVVPFAPWADTERADGKTQVQDVELRGDIAWVEVIAGRDPLRRVQFYRQTDLGWRHTAPRSAFWGEPQEFDLGKVIVRCRRRDLDPLAPTVAHVLEVHQDVCASLGCPVESPLEVEFAVDVPVERLPAQVGGRLLLASPWLQGIPVDGVWDQEYLAELRYWVAYSVSAQGLRGAAGGQPGEVSPPNLLQRALLDEYAALYSGGDLADAPLLRRVVERHGEAALPDVIGWLGGDATFLGFAQQWLLSPEESLKTAKLLDIAWEAKCAQRRDTFVLVTSLPAEDPLAWVEWVELRPCSTIHPQQHSRPPTGSALSGPRPRDGVARGQLCALDVHPSATRHINEGT